MAKKITKQELSEELNSNLNSLDTELDALDIEVDGLTDEVTANKNNIESNKTNIESILNVLNKHQNDLFPHGSDYSQYSSDKDENGFYTTVTVKRTDGTNYMTSVASNPNGNGKYQTIRWTFFDSDGNTEIAVRTWTIEYDENGTVISKVVA